MLRIVTVILICLTFFALGLVGEELRNIFSYNDSREEPWPTQLCVDSFPINGGRFLESTSAFAAATLVVLLLSFQVPPLIKPERFTQYCLLICLLFALYFSLFALALMLPRHLLIMETGTQATPLNIGFAIANFVLWATALFLFARLFFKPRLRITPLSGERPAERQA